MQPSNKRMIHVLTMADPNLIACLYPAEDHVFGNALRLVCMTENESRRIEPLLEDRSRHSSKAPEDGVFEDDSSDDDGDDDNGQQSEKTTKPPNHNYSSGLQLRFDDERKN